MDRPGCAERKKTRWLPGLALGMFVLSVGVGGVCFAQAPAQEPKSQEPKPPNTKPTSPAPSAGSATQTSAGSGSTAVDSSQAQLLADTEKLVKLSQELKAEVAKSTKDTLSVSVVRKAEEVEALAKNLRGRMNKVR